MKPQTDPRHDAYIADARAFAQPILRRLRQLVHQACPAVEETIKWGHLSFTLDGKILCGMAAFKAHATFGFWHQGMEKLLAKEFGRTYDAMGHMGRITTLADLPPEAALRRYIRRAAELMASGTPARPKPKPKPALPVPADLGAALKKNPAAAKVFKDFSPSARRDYIEWITEAKRAETRHSRLATALEWIAAGKQRNWKYMNC